MGVSEALKNRGNLILAGVGIASASLLVHGGIDVLNIRNYSSSLAASRYPEVTDASVNDAWKVIRLVGMQYDELFQRQGETNLISGRGSIDDYQKAAASPDLKAAHSLLLKQAERSKYIA